MQTFLHLAEDLHAKYLGLCQKRSYIPQWKCNSSFLTQIVIFFIHGFHDLQEALHPHPMPCVRSTACTSDRCHMDTDHLDIPLHLHVSLVPLLPIHPYWYR